MASGAGRHCGRGSRRSRDSRSSVGLSEGLRRLKQNLTRTSRRARRRNTGFTGRIIRLSSALERSGGKGLGLIEFCAAYDAIELWIDPGPNAQLNLIWLVGLCARPRGAGREDEIRPGGFRHRRSGAGRARHDGSHRASTSPTTISTWPSRHGAPIVRRRRMLGSNLLQMDLSSLPRLAPAVAQLLEELPLRATGLGCDRNVDAWVHIELRCEPVRISLLASCNAERAGSILTTGKSASCWTVLHIVPRPPSLVSTRDRSQMELHDDRERHRRYTQSKLSLTALGKAIRSADRRFQPAQPDPSLVGWHRI